ncbi:hypothetical protein F5148DRAFT_1285683 [Russula earlei]|uniref:Uncharacterized protein n=1 Tax=Russula earlei TaxID=71964 RepID=A0ACC0U7M4_9AGAM|nr:hypothetical protein F5148DRAFT_1285683 [Russula earlei]
MITQEPAALALPRSSSAPPGRYSAIGTSRTVGPPDRAFPRSKTPNFASGPRRNPIPAVPFGRNTRRSAVTGTVLRVVSPPHPPLDVHRRRASFDKPVADLSALGVESRIGIVTPLDTTPRGARGRRSATYQQAERELGPHFASAPGAGATSARNVHVRARDPRDVDLTNRRPARILVSKMDARVDAPLPATITTSRRTPSETAAPSISPPVVIVFSASTTSSSVATPSLNSSAVQSLTVKPIAVLPPAASISAHPKDIDGTRDVERVWVTTAIVEASLTVLGSPSKYTRHGASHATRTWSLAGASSNRTSTRSDAPTSRESTTGPDARSRESIISPSDEEISRHDFTRNISVRRKILERLQRAIVRSARSLSRDPSRRTARTYPSSASVYSGTHSGDSRTPTAMSSTPPSRNADTEWVPGSGFRIVEEIVPNPLPPSTADQSSVSGLPERTGVWDGEALRRAVDTHPGERWLAWTRSWALSPPPPPGGDRFTAVLPRRTAQEKRDAEVLLLRSPPQITSSTLQSTLNFSSPQPGPPAPPVTKGNNNTTTTGDTTSTRRRRHTARRVRLRTRAAWRRGTGTGRRRCAMRRGIRPSRGWKRSSHTATARGIWRRAVRVRGLGESSSASRAPLSK